MPDFPGKQDGAVRDIYPPQHDDTQDSWVEARVWINRHLQPLQLSGTISELTRLNHGCVQGSPGSPSLLLHFPASGPFLEQQEAFRVMRVNASFESPLRKDRGLLVRAALGAGVIESGVSQPRGARSVSLPGGPGASRAGAVTVTGRTLHLGMCSPQSLGPRGE